MSPSSLETLLVMVGNLGLAAGVFYLITRLKPL